MNLLENGNFEADWGDDESHRVRVIPADGVPYWADIGNIFTPSRWTSWFHHCPGTYDQPEVRDAHKSQTPERVYEGEKATLLFTFGRGHDAGFFQQVNVEPGTTLCLSAWAHAWSNHKDKSLPDKFPHPDDPLWSEGAGYAPREPQEGEQHMWLAGSTADDNLTNFTFYVGIDPTGGINPLANTVVWGTGAHIYNAFALVPPVEVVAESSNVTVFLRSKTRWPFKHNDAYWDAAELVVVDEEPEPEGRGLPRIQYDRTYVLLPQNAALGLVLALVRTGGWDNHRFTIGSSADDAGIGDLDVRRVIAINPSEWPGSLEDFFATYYQGVEYIEVHDANESNVGLKVLGILEE
jgi:hypothetical protein